METEGVQINRAQVEKLIQEFKLYEYSTVSAEILLGLKKRVENCWSIIFAVINEILQIFMLLFIKYIF